MVPELLDIRVEDRADGIIVATPNQLHVENGMEIVAAGIPVLIEKPIADDVDAAAALVGAGRRRQGHRCSSAITGATTRMIQAVKQIVDGGRLGRITVHGTFWVAKPDDYFDIPWRREAGAGPGLRQPDPRCRSLPIFLRRGRSRPCDGI
ncbi:Gfo/Idh/MocA family oxidoreductase [Rhizobium beringeri]